MKTKKSSPVAQFHEARYESVRLQDEEICVVWQLAILLTKSKKQYVVVNICVYGHCIWYSLIFFRTYRFDTDLFWAEYYPILLGVVFLLFQRLIHSWLLFFFNLFVFLYVQFHFVFLNEKNSKY